MVLSQWELGLYKISPGTEQNTQRDDTNNTAERPSLSCASPPVCLPFLPFSTRFACASHTHTHTHKSKETLKLVAERNIDANGDKSRSRDLHIDIRSTLLSPLLSILCFSLPFLSFSFSLLPPNVKSIPKVSELCRLPDPTPLCPELSATNARKGTKRGSTCAVQVNAPCVLCRLGTNLIRHLFAPQTQEAARASRIAFPAQGNSPHTPHSLCHTRSRTHYSCLTWWRRKAKRMRTPGSMVGSISLGVKRKEIQDRVIEAGSALLIIPLSKRRRERKAFRREPPAANFLKIQLQSDQQSIG